MRVRRKQHILSTTQITLSKILISSFISIKSQGLNAKSFGFVTGLKKSSFNAIKVFKTNVTRSQRNGKINTRIKYCRRVAGRKLATRSILSNLKLEE